MPTPSEVPEHWHSFLAELDLALTEPVCFHCIGGFVVSMCYGLERPTVDVDVISMVPNGQRTMLQELGGERSPLDKKYGVHIQFVAVAHSARTTRTACGKCSPAHTVTFDYLH
jgi:hypothetical protein